MTGTQLQKLRFATGSIPLMRMQASPEQLVRISGMGAPVEAAA
jgi:hypothetical protein